MKKVYYLFFVIIAVFACSAAKGQLLPPNQPEQDACQAIQICGNTFTSSFSYQGIGLVSDLTNTPCSGGENNSMWMRLDVNTGGIIVFTITPINNADDYDFAIVNITGKTCSTFTQNDVIRCQFNNNWPTIWNNGIVGLNTTSTLTTVVAGANAQNFLQQINANSGDSYLIMINNFGLGGSGGPSSGFTIDFTGSTATFNGTNPLMSALIPSCNNAQQITLVMNQNILCNSIAPNGSDFTVAGGTIASITGNNCGGSNGYTDTLVINFASPLPPGTYNLDAQVGSDGNTLLNTCNMPLLTPASLQFIVPPYDPPKFVSIEQPACQEIRVKLNTRVRCDSIAKDGSDFTVTGPQAGNVIAAFGVGCDTANFTDTVVLLLQSPLIADGVYSITAKEGTDNNTLMDSCGIHQAIGDVITMSLNSYDGGIVAMPDTIICTSEYINLRATNNSLVPPMAMNCDVTPITCSGNVRTAYVGGKDNPSSLNSPFSGSFDDQRVQYLFHADELRGMGLKAGMINALDLKVTQQLSTIPYSNFTIKIGCSAANSFGTTFSVGTQQVYTNPSYNTVAGWNHFALTTPFNWDGNSNLIVEMCYDNIVPSSDDDVEHSTTPFISVIRRFGHSLSGCSLTTQGTLSTATTVRPRMRFYICEPPAGLAGYLWSPGTFLSDSTILQPLAFINDNVTYHVTTIDKFGCAHRDSMSVTFSTRTVDVTPVDTTICFGQQVELQATGGLTYNWVAADPSTLTCLDCPKTIAKPQQTSVYTVVIGDQYNCLDTLTSTVNINQLPFVNITPGDLTAKYGSTVQLVGSGARLYTWTPPRYISDPNIVNPILTVTDPVTIILTGIDENGCRNTDSIRITVDYTDPVFIPTAFSPNGDGRNDDFGVGSLSFQKLMEFRIFNRWGQEVFSTNDPAKKWDGSFEGTPQENGVYNYIIRLAYPGGRVEVYKGDVTLIR